MSVLNGIKDKISLAGDRVANELARGQIYLLQKRYRNVMPIVKECKACMRALEKDDNSEWMIHSAGLNLAINDYNTRKFGVTAEKRKEIEQEATPKVEEKLKKTYGVLV